MRALSLAIFALSLPGSCAAEEPTCNGVDAEEASLLQSRQRVRQLPDDSTTSGADGSIGDEFGQAMNDLGDLKDVPPQTISSVGSSIKQAMQDWKNAQSEQKKWDEENDKLKKIEQSVEDMPTPVDASLLKSRQRVRQLPDDSTTSGADGSIGDEFGQAMSDLGDLKDVPPQTISSVGSSIRQAMQDWKNAQSEQKKWEEENDKLKKIEQSVEDMPTPADA